jgi:hypothetical protein
MFSKSIKNRFRNSKISMSVLFLVNKNATHEWNGKSNISYMCSSKFESQKLSYYRFSRAEFF